MVMEENGVYVRCYGNDLLHGCSFPITEERKVNGSIGLYGDNFGVSRRLTRRNAPCVRSRGLIMLSHCAPSRAQMIAMWLGRLNGSQEGTKRLPMISYLLEDTNTIRTQPVYEPARRTRVD